MITLNDVRKNFEEKNWAYKEHKKYLLVKTSTPREQLPTLFKLSSNGTMLYIHGFLANPIDINLNETVLKALHNLNLKFRLFPISLERTYGGYLLIMRKSIAVDYVSDPEIAAEILVFALQVLDDAYAEIMKANLAQ